MTSATAVSGREVQAIGLISFAHFCSHFYLLALPPLFPFIRAELGVSYVELGLLLTVNAAATGVLQTPCGFLVDRIGARRVLIAGLALNALAVALAGFTASYAALLMLWLLAGIGNAVFHPADYVILSASVADRRIGRAFSVHSFGGSAGLAVAPFVMLTLAALADWRTALVVVGVIGLGLAAAIALFGEALREDAARKREPSAGIREGLRLLMSRQMVILFLIYAATAAAGSGINAFAVVALVDLFAVDVAAAANALTGFLVMIAIGVIAGGVLADRTARHDLVLVVAFVGVTALYCVVGLAQVPFWLAAAALLGAGFLRGMVNPSRDVIARLAAPPGSVGKVFAFVTMGFSVGGTVTPLLFGWMMDLGQPAVVFYAGAGFSVLAILLVFVSRQRHL